MHPSISPTIKSNRIIMLIFGLCLFFHLQAQNRNQKSSNWQFGVGNTYVYDDYLSPLAHEGSSLLFFYGNAKPLKWSLPDSLDATFENVKWIQQTHFSINPVYALSSVGSTIYHGNVDLRYSLIRQLRQNPIWSASAGPYISIGGGGRYCINNGNNPGSLDLYADLGIIVLTDYKFKILKKPVKLTYQGSLALSGLAFSPEYAESYYEIFSLGNKNNVVKYTHPLNNQHWRQQLSLDIPLSHRKSSFRLTYQNDGHVSLLNNIRTRILSNHFSIGYIRYFNIL